MNDKEISRVAKELFCYKFIKFERVQFQPEALHVKFVTARYVSGSEIKSFERITELKFNGCGHNSDGIYLEFVR